MGNRAAYNLRLTSRSRHEQVEIPHRLPSTAQTSRRGDLLDAGEGTNQRDNALRMFLRGVNAKPRRVLPVVLDALQQLRGELLSHSRQFQQLPCPCCRFQLVDVRNLQGRPQQSHCLRSHTRKPQQFQHRRTISREKLLPQRHGSGGHQVAYVRGHALPDSRYSEKELRVNVRTCKSCEGGCLLLHCLGCPAIGAYAKRIGGIDLEQCGGLIQQTCDGDVIHS